MDISAAFIEVGGIYPYVCTCLFCDGDNSAGMVKMAVGEENMLQFQLVILNII